MEKLWLRKNDDEDDDANHDLWPDNLPETPPLDKLFDTPQPGSDDDEDEDE